MENSKETSPFILIRKTPEDERPRERCLQQGAHVLSLRECIAVILGTGPRGVGCKGIAEKLLHKPGIGMSSSEEEKAFFTGMEISPLASLSEISGLGDVGKTRILAAFEIARRYSRFRESSRPQTSGKNTDVILRTALAKLSLDLRNDSQEWIGFVPVYPSLKLGDFCLVERGVRTHVNFDPAEFFARLLSLRVRGFVLFHNHPSGNLKPSQPDLLMTKQLQEMAQMFGIPLLGHGIVAVNSESWVAL